MLPSLEISYDPNDKAKFGILTINIDIKDAVNSSVKKEFFKAVRDWAIKNADSMRKEVMVLAGVNNLVMFVGSVKSKNGKPKIKLLPLKKIL